MNAAAKVLDPCSASRMMWFDKQDQRALFGDIRDEEHVLCDGRVLKVEPNVIMDFRSLPFEDGAFKLVVFDPPHLKYAGKDSWLRAKYGVLTNDWRDDISKGFAECFRVLASDGVLIFKWAEDQIKVSELLALTDEKPLFGHKSGKREKTHWITFMKRSTMTEAQLPLIPRWAVLPHPPRHAGFLQPDREVPGYTLEQMLEYGRVCAIEAVKQSK